MPQAKNNRHGHRPLTVVFLFSDGISSFMLGNGVFGSARRQFLFQAQLKCVN